METKRNVCICQKMCDSILKMVKWIHLENEERIIWEKQEIITLDKGEIITLEKEELISLKMVKLLNLKRRNSIEKEIITLEKVGIIA